MDAEAATGSNYFAGKASSGTACIYGVSHGELAWVNPDLTMPVDPATCNFSIKDVPLTPAETTASCPTGQAC